MGRPPLWFYFLPYFTYLYLLSLSLSFYLKHTLLSSDLSLGKHCGLKKKFFFQFILISLWKQVISGAWLSQFTFYPFLFLFISVRGWGSNPFFDTKICMILGKPVCPSWAQLVCVKALCRLQSIYKYDDWTRWSQFHWRSKIFILYFKLYFWWIQLIQESGIAFWHIAEDSLRYSKADDDSKQQNGEFPAVQLLGLCAFTEEDAGSIPGRGTKIPQATWYSQKTKQNKQTKNPEWFVTKNRFNYWGWKLPRIIHDFKEKAEFADNT